MRIGIDARFLGPIGKGLGRYTQKLIENLEEIDRQNQYIIFLRKENWNDYNPRFSNFKKVLAPFYWYTLKEQIMMPRVIREQKVDLMHFPHFNVPFFYAGKFIVTIHDLILLRFPTKKATTLGPVKYKVKEWGYKIVINRAIKKAERVIAVSEFTKNDILNYFKISPKKVVTIYEGVDQPSISGHFSLSGGEKKTVESEILKKYGVVKPYLLYVGNVYPHKNIEILLSVMKKIGSMNEKILSDLKLVIVCKQDYFLEKIKNLAGELRILDRIIFTGYAPDADLTHLYKNAELYVFPSFYEGFGLPPLEAMVQGTPVISSSFTSMPEILEDAALYFDPNKIEDIIASIRNVLTDSDVRRKLVDRGHELVKKYHWSKMAEETIKLYSKI